MKKVQKKASRFDIRSIDPKLAAPLLSGFLILGVLVYASNTTVSRNSRAYEQDSCTPGQTSDQGCAAHGCEQGTRRVCTCLADKDWSCQCQTDNSCGGGGGGTGGGGGGGTGGGGTGGTGRPPADTKVTSTQKACYDKNCRPKFCFKHPIEEALAAWGRAPERCRQCVRDCLK